MQCEVLLAGAGRRPRRFFAPERAAAYCEARPVGLGEDRADRDARRGRLQLRLNRVMSRQLRTIRDEVRD